MADLSSDLNELKNIYLLWTLSDWLCWVSIFKFYCWLGWKETLTLCCIHLILVTMGSFGVILVTKWSLDTTVNLLNSLSIKQNLLHYKGSISLNYKMKVTNTYKRLVNKMNMIPLSWIWFSLWTPFLLDSGLSDSSWVLIILSIHSLCFLTSIKTPGISTIINSQFSVYFYFRIYLCIFTWFGWPRHHPN